MVTTLRNMVVLTVGLWTTVLSAQEDPPGAAARIEMWRHSRLALTRAQDDTALAAFSTDGCSGGMSQAWKSIATVFPEFAVAYDVAPPWEFCCVTHDRAYHLAGYDPTPSASFTARLQADEALRSCVNQVAISQGADLQTQYQRSQSEIEIGFAFVADRMFEAVRFGGAPCSGLSWRWGYGWPQCW